MTTHTFYVDLDGTTSRPVTVDEVDDIVDRLRDHAAVAAFDPHALDLSVAIDTGDIIDAARRAVAHVDAAVRSATDAGDPLVVTWESVTAMTDAARTRSLIDPEVPPLVGFPEIATIAGVSVSRARKFVDIEGFPPAVASTSSGPLRARAAVEAWAAARDRRPGRRPAAT